MKEKLENIGLVGLGILVAVGLVTTLFLSLTDRLLTNEMMFGLLGSMIVLFGMSILRKFPKRSRS